MRRIVSIALTALLFTSLVPLVEAHAAPAARSFETRIMHDHNDDSTFLIVQGKHGFDAIALDVREGFDIGTGPVIIFRLLLNGGCNSNPNAPAECPELSHVVTFKADGAEQSVKFATPDGGETWGGDAPRYEGPFSINDGDRFAIEAWVPWSQIGVTAGSALTDWFVEGYAGTTTADNMPEGAVAGYEDPLEAAFVLDSYEVKAPDYYLSIEAGPAKIQSKSGEETRWAFNLTSLLDDTQTVTFTTLGLPASVVRGEGVVSEEMAPGVTREYEVVLMPTQTGSVTLIVTSDLGGAVAVAFQVSVPVKSTGLNVLSGDIAAGGNFSHTFGQMGTVEYHDHHNAVAGGKIVIAAPKAEKVTHTITYDGAAFTPAELNISMGDTVIWQNNGEAAMKIMGSGMAGHGHDHDHDHEDAHHDKDTPGVHTVLVALGLLGAALVARRR